jgi:hypothetical protein
MAFFDSYKFGAGALEVDIVNATNDNAVSGTVYSGFRLHSNGGVYYQEAAGTWAGPIYNWVTPTTSAPNYEVFVSVTGDELSTGTIDSWIALTSTQSWNILSVGVRKEAVLTVSIRPTGGSAIDTATITLGAGEAV